MPASTKSDAIAWPDRSLFENENMARMEDWWSGPTCVEVGEFAVTIWKEQVSAISAS